MDETITSRLSQLFDELVPAEGKASSLAGEIVRAINRLGYRFYNDGDQLGIGYGKETCNPAGRFLAKETTDDIARKVREIWGLHNEDLYEEKLDQLMEMVADYVEEHPDLRDLETKDMWDYQDPHEDVDDYEDDDDD